MELRKIYGKWDTGIGKYWHRIETTGGKSLKRPQRAVEPRKKKKNAQAYVRVQFLLFIVFLSV
jgi:hypothetical protein